MAVEMMITRTVTLMFLATAVFVACHPESDQKNQISQRFDQAMRLHDAKKFFTD